jgi:hypothetical protein
MAATAAVQIAQFVLRTQPYGEHTFTVYKKITQGHGMVRRDPHLTRVL